jgi:hypothetical protein
MAHLSRRVSRLKCAHPCVDSRGIRSRAVHHRRGTAPWESGQIIPGGRSDPAAPVTGAVLLRAGTVYEHSARRVKRHLFITHHEYLEQRPRVVVHHVIALVA